MRLKRKSRWIVAGQPSGLRFVAYLLLWRRDSWKAWAFTTTMVVAHRFPERRPSVQRRHRLLRPSWDMGAAFSPP